MAKVLMPLPARDFDPTETAIPWRILTQAGHEVVFATPAGEPGAADDIMVSGQGLDPWGFAPGFKTVALVGRILGANADARSAYRAMAASPAFGAPLRWAALDVGAFDGLLLPGGHRARGMRAFLESATLQALVVAFFQSARPVGAICHGVVLAARSIDPRTGRSVLFGRKTTALTWRLERAAHGIARITRFWDPNYYRTYTERPGEPAGYASVEHEVARALRSPADFLDVPRDAAHYTRKSSGLARDSDEDATPAWVVRDGNYVSARWPGDAHTFAKAFAELLTEAVPPS
ncbi:MAG: DJ-1/PfpI family protein [Hyphomonadaceae bacterium]|nr:DJ-1/PfpI family protein [Hyphomonadaceae bacterium]